MANRTRLLSLGIIASLLAMLVSALFATPPSRAATAELMPGQMIELRASGHNEFTRIAPPRQRPLAPSATVITVNYIGTWDPQAQVAFQYAVDLWEGYVYSPIPITVDASWEALGTGVLGSAGAITYSRNFTGAPRTGTWYPIALANALFGSDRDPAQSDIRARFSSVFNWYLGTDGNTPAGQYDFVSVVLHEVGHGLGFAGSARVDTGTNQGSWGLTAGGVTSPTTYDVYTENGAGTDTIDTAAFANPSAALASHLQSDNLYWSGAKALATNSGVRPRLYAPTTWQQGSSYSHLNEATYPAGNVNSLMTPQFGAAEAIHSPGPIGLGVLGDIGWPSAPVVATATPTATSTTATATSGPSPTATIPLVLDKRVSIPFIVR
jgi:hypothetical protein